MATGALVGKSAVLTSSHVVPWGVFKICTVKFTPGYLLGKSILGEGVFSYCTGARGFSDYSQGDDMAVLRLSTPLGDDDALGYFGYKTYNDAWEGGDYWSLIGYPGTWKGVYLGGGYPTRESGIIITDDDDDGAGLELEHTGDSTDGNSGGPLWGWWGESPRVIGVQSGSEISYLGECNNLAAGGPALSKLIKYARNNW
jgi:hypothetical protein